MPTEKEIKLCIELHELGLRPEIRKGDWVKTYSGGIRLVDNQTDAGYRNEIGNREEEILIWTWERAREWLREKGWTDLNHYVEGESNEIWFYKPPNDVGKYGKGQTDLECALAVMAQVAEEKNDL